MNRERLANLTRSLCDRPSRRHLLAGLAGGILGSNTSRLSHGASARRKRRRKKRKNRKGQEQEVAFNDFGCVDVGSFCQTSEQCCSGVCDGKQGKKSCQGHDESTCEAGQDNYCSGGPPISCDTTAEYAGACVSTTGNASYCQHTAYCHECRKDADCVRFCGERSACIVADDCCPTTGTACAVVEPASCTFP